MTSALLTVAILAGSVRCLPVPEVPNVSRQAVVVNVVDGDTVDVEYVAIELTDAGGDAKLGVRIVALRRERLRLRDINADPPNTPRGKAATDRLRELVDGRLIQMETRWRRDQWQRLLASLCTMKGDDISATLRREGLVESWP